MDDLPTLTPEGPVLSVPEDAAEGLRAAYAEADVILEYGPGGSTVLAAKQPGKRVFAIESDRNWVRQLKQWFAENPPAEGTTVDVRWQNIGPTKGWGAPVDDQRWRHYAKYTMEIWDDPDFPQPDVVLVDGRFRMGSCLAVAYRTKAPLRMFVDDYRKRKRYHLVEEFIGAPVKMHGRMAEFHIEPTPIPADRLTEIIRIITKP